MRSGRVAGGWLIIVCCLSQFLHTVYGSVANIALPDISRDLGAGIDSLQWVVSAYVLTLASLLIFAGNLADRIGRRRVLVLGNVVMIVGSIICAVSTSVPPLIVGRVVQGVGSALIAPAGLSLLAAAFPQRAQRAVAVMWWTTIGTASLAAGPILGGLLVKDLGWTSVFWAGVPLGVVASILALALLHESRSDRPTPFDGVGQVLLTLLLAAVAFTLIEGVHLGWTSVPVLMAIAVAVASLIALVPYEQRRADPLLPLHLLSDRPFVTALSMAVSGYLALAGLLFVNTFYLQSERGLNATQAGLMTIPLAAGATASALLAARLVTRGHSRAALVASGVLLALGAGGLWMTEHAALWTVIVPYFVFGFGFGLIADPVSVTALSELPTAESGLASSLISTSKQTGQLLGIAGAGSILAVAGVSSDSVAFDDMGGWVWAVLLAAGVLIAGLALSTPREHIAVPRKRAAVR
ncbi:MFS transporter [Microbacterium sp. zg.Y625]|uniref:MFS transporter n=1 Tax=Microbacterium jiangjiandongii TaxID=3049071 RepID=UPI00214CBB9F|nr:MULTISPECIES: MFS transporter [unclassified Microbacterium]MCR2792062.1 MFS transporter [Microbacterium sp. zg.Y625]MCR2814849.1 MFS transporter [Microbacterium sp. zg.Y843]WIM24869.1 MFS transporter [Microbacterium sp. zg-Y625]